MFKLFTKEKIKIVEKFVLPTSSFSVGDIVIVKFLTETKKGKVIGKSFLESSVFNGSIKEFIPVQFDDGTIDATWDRITHKI